MTRVRVLASFLLSLGVFAISFVPSTSSSSAVDDRPTVPVGYTEARTYAVPRTIELSGTVRARTSATVAAEVQGKVMELLAREGRSVRKGSPLIRLRTDHLEIERTAAEANLREAEARLELAQKHYDRAEELFRRAVLSGRQRDDARFERDARQGRVDDLKAKIARLELDVDRAVVKAPFSGVVVAEHTEIGQWIGTGDPVVDMISVVDLEVVVDVPERHFGNIARGTEASIRFEALPGYEAPGRVDAVIPRASPSAHTFPIKVRFRSADDSPGVGMLATVSFEAESETPAMIVPKDALIGRGSDRSLYLIKADQTVDRVSVSTGVELGEWVEVQGPLAAGTKVVSRGKETLTPGQMVLAKLVEYPSP